MQQKFVYKNKKIPQSQYAQQAAKTQQVEEIPLAHNGQNNHNQRRSSKVPVRELPEAMPKYQHSVYPQLYCAEEPSKTTYKWECIILDLDRTIIHGKRLSVKRWRKYVENGTIPSLAENQCSKWHRHIHRKGHQMHPFIRGRTMIYYRPFTWHLLAVLDYLKSHFGTKIIVCTKAGEHYAASVLAALISNFTSANPDLIDDVYNFHDLHDDAEDEGKPKKPFRLICNRHNLDPKKTLIVDDNATSWFDADRLITNFWMPPCYGYQIHDIDNELQLLCKYLWDPIQKHHLEKKLINNANANANAVAHKASDHEQANKRYQHEQDAQATSVQKLKVKVKHLPQHSQTSESTESSLISPNSTPQRDIISRSSPKSVSSNTLSPKNQQYLSSPHSHSQISSNNGNSPKNLNELESYPLEYAQSRSMTSTFSVSTTSVDAADTMGEHAMSHHISSHNKQNAVDKMQFAQILEAQQAHHQDYMDEHKVNHSAVPRISRSYNKRKYSQNATIPAQNSGLMIMQMSEPAATSSSRTASNSSSSSAPSKRSPKAEASKTKKKGYFFETKSRGSKKLAKIIGK
eukprot:CAMPEP_0197042474 /NCGR_PEP_ID=MMETSP1384-20130603/18837_1 /TAXON_ID=29189 /ORGANISM="Ammonia sp." /LENGTH=572 /DNA_ID=CAMNT_0042473581 /DNA_START=133 /DNA_END=1851 /DNA_ORIENTATION=-